MTHNELSKPDFLKFSFLIVLSQIIYSALGFIFLPIFLNELSIEEYGLIAYRFNVAQLLATILILGFDHSIERSSIVKKFSFFYSCALFFMASLLAISFGLMIIFLLSILNILEDLDISSITLIFIFLVMGALFMRFLAAFNGGHIKGIIIIISVSIFSLIFLIALFSESISINQRINWLLIPSYSVIAASIFLVFKQLFLNKIELKGIPHYKNLGTDLKHILKDTKELIPYILVSAILLNLDKIVIKQFWGNFEVGIYDVSMKLAAISLVLFSGFKMMLPKMLSNFRKGRISFWHDNWILASTIIYWLSCIILIFVAHFFFTSIQDIKPLIYLANAIVFISLLNMYGFSARKVEQNPLSYSRIILLCSAFSAVLIYFCGYMFAKYGLNFYNLYLVVIFCSLLMYVIYRFSSLKDYENNSSISTVDIICFVPMFLNILFMLSFNEYFHLYNNSLSFNIILTIIMIISPVTLLFKKINNG